MSFYNAETTVFFFCVFPRPLITCIIGTEEPESTVPAIAILSRHGLNMYTLPSLVFIDCAVLIRMKAGEEPLLQSHVPLQHGMKGGPALAVDTLRYITVRQGVDDIVPCRMLLFQCVSLALPYQKRSLNRCELIVLAC